MANRITPRTLRGFRDFLPEMMMPREKLIDRAKEVYRSFGFSPIDTPALELLEILTGKGGEETDRQLYQFEDAGGRRVGMRFDLTVPLARFVAQHAPKLGLPFKRYHIATVWRGENTQRGRYREFMQCDFDTIGSLAVATDIETALVIHDLMRRMDLTSQQDFTAFQIRINNRQILNGLLDQLGLSEGSTLILRALDKLPKIGAEKVGTEISVSGADAGQVNKILEFASLQGSNDEILTRLSNIIGGNEVGQAGVARLADTIQGIRAAGIDESHVQIDVSIARGLDYYTGMIYETFLTDLPTIGSVCSGGRYDNLAELYTKQQLPGIGASLGLDRLLAALEELNKIEKVATPAKVFVAFFDKQRLHDYLSIANLIRQSGISVELYPDPKKLGAQLKYADERGFRIAVIAGDQELDKNEVQVKDLAAKSSSVCSLEQDGEELIKELGRILA